MHTTIQGGRDRHEVRGDAVIAFILSRLARDRMVTVGLNASAKALSPALGRDDVSRPLLQCRSAARLKAGDLLAVYSPRTAFPDGEPFQAFTALGTVRTGQVYQMDMAPDLKPYRVDVDFAQVREAPIRPLIPDLRIIRDKARLGAAFRFGQLRVPEADFRLMAAAMGCAWPEAAVNHVAPTGRQGLLAPG